MTAAAASIAARAARRLEARQRRELIADHCWEWWQIHGQGLSIDRLLCRPTLTLKMVRYVRAVLKRGKTDAEEAEICEAFLHQRKSGKFQVEKRAKKKQ